MTRAAVWIVCAMLSAVLCVPALRADEAAAFYRGKDVNLIAGFNVGGGADLYARLIARHLGEHIPGHPTVIVHNMPGAGSMAAANHIFNVSPRDGSEIGLFAGNVAVDPVIGGVPSQYDARKFNWLGAPAAETSICLASKTSSFQTFADVLSRDMVTGSAGTSTYDFPLVMNSLIGTRFHLVKGYNGSSALRLALERGEIEGFCGVGLTAVRSLGLTDATINILVQIALQKNPALGDVPLVMDYAKSEADRQVMRLVFGWLVMERPLAAPPDTPASRVTALREAFDDTMRDPSFVADLATAALAFAPTSGNDIANFVDEMYRTPPAVAKRAAQLLGRSEP